MDAARAPGQSKPFWNNFEVLDQVRSERNDFNILMGDRIYSDTEVGGVTTKAFTVKRSGPSTSSTSARGRCSAAHRGGHLLPLGRPRVHQRLLAQRHRGRPRHPVLAGDPVPAQRPRLPGLRAGHLHQVEGDLPHRPLGQEPGAVLPRRALLPQRQGRHGLDLRQPARQRRTPTSRRPRRSRIATSSLPSSRSWPTPCPRAARPRSTIPSRTFLGAAQLARFKAAVNARPRPSR